MEQRFRFLVIAPYEGMKTSVQRVAEEFPEVDLTFFVGNLLQGVEIAKNNFYGDYDAVISRGGTAMLLRQYIQLPVVEMEVSMYDLMCSLTLANRGTECMAIVSFSNLIKNVQLLCDVMKYNIELYPVDSTDDVEPALRRLLNKRYGAILCDVIADATAKRMGLNSILITSGDDSIRKAFDEALLLCRSQQYLRDENLFFRELLNGQMSPTVVFDEDGKLFLSTLDEPFDELLDMLRDELAETLAEPKRRFVRTLNGVVYTVRSQKITSGRLSLIAFSFVSRRYPFSLNRLGISFGTRSEAERSYLQSAFNFSGLVRELTEEIERIIQSDAPIMIAGENGTGKESLVQYLYVHGSLCNHPLVSVNCSLLNDKSWSFLLESHNSPLMDQMETIYFSGIDTLPYERQQQLSSALLEMEVHRRNRIIFSCVCPPGERVSAVGLAFMDKLSCFYFYLPPLREMLEQLPSVFTQLVNTVNMTLPRQIVGMTSEADKMLRQFQWPHNYKQLQRVVGELALRAKGQMITSEDVAEALAKERYVIGSLDAQTVNTGFPLDLKKTLDEINQEIAFMILRENGGNHLATAEQLGVSRTTLWRLLKRRDEKISESKS